MRVYRVEANEVVHRTVVRYLVSDIDDPSDTEGIIDGESDGTSDLIDEDTVEGSENIVNSWPHTETLAPVTAPADWERVALSLGWEPVIAGREALVHEKLGLQRPDRDFEAAALQVLTLQRA